MKVVYLLLPLYLFGYVFSNIHEDSLESEDESRLDSKDERYPTEGARIADDFILALSNYYAPKWKKTFTNPKHRFYIHGYWVDRIGNIQTPTPAPGATLAPIVPLQTPGLHAWRADHWRSLMRGDMKHWYEEYHKHGDNRPQEKYFADARSAYNDAMGIIAVFNGLPMTGTTAVSYVQNELRQNTRIRNLQLRCINVTTPLHTYTYLQEVWITVDPTRNVVVDRSQWANNCGLWFNMTDGTR
uniref:Conserved secreted protein n=1 Tax=Steinernema glaseri TaxID=37863 RepID=A0A1I7XY74_9BILA